MYVQEQKTSKLLTWASGLTCFLSCLGLLGLVIYATQRRTKEIGIRKVLGASVQNITLLLSKDMIRLVFIAILIALPVAWWAANKWLQDFVYRIDLSFWTFIMAGMFSILFALVTLSFHVVRTAWANPVNSLRSE
jgi:ABC-type antimicrobial peptide transport system permease subunit